MFLHHFLLISLPIFLSASQTTSPPVYRQNLTQFNEAYVQLSGPFSIDSLDQPNLLKKRPSQSPTSVCQVVCGEIKRAKMARIATDYSINCASDPVNSDNETLSASVHHLALASNYPSSSSLASAEVQQITSNMNFSDYGMIFDPDFIPTDPLLGMFRQPEYMVSSEVSIEYALESYRFELYANSTIQSIYNNNNNNNNKPF